MITQQITYVHMYISDVCRHSAPLLWKVMYNHACIDHAVNSNLDIELCFHTDDSFSQSPFIQAGLYHVCVPIIMTACSFCLYSQSYLVKV